MTTTTITFLATSGATMLTVFGLATSWLLKPAPKVDVTAIECGLEG
jgi:hypothetical protein